VRHDVCALRVSSSAACSTYLERSEDDQPAHLAHHVLVVRLDERYRARQDVLGLGRVQAVERSRVDCVPELGLESLASTVAREHLPRRMRSHGTLPLTGFRRASSINMQMSFRVSHLGPIKSSSAGFALTPSRSACASREGFRSAA
jgi:hypothetical protein